MFKIDAEPTFPAKLTIVGQSRTQELNVVFRHKTRSEYAELMDKVAKLQVDAADAFLQLVESWDADAELSAANVKRLDEQQPGALFAIIGDGYSEALSVARKGN